MPAAVIDPVNPELVPLRAAGRPAGRTPEEASDGAADLSAAKLLHALRRRWLIAVPLAMLAAAAAGYAGSRFVRPVSTVRAMVHLSAERPAAVYENSTEGRPDFAHQQRSQVLVLKSRAVLQAVVRTLEPAGLAVLAQPDPVGWLEQELQTDYAVAPDILRLSLKGTDPAELTAVLDALRTTLIREIERRDREGRDGRARQLADVRDQHEAKAAGLRRQLLAKAEGLGSRDAVTLRAEHDYALGVVHALRTEVAFHKSAVRRAELENGPTADPPPDPAVVAAALAAAATDPPLLAAAAELNKQELALADLKGKLNQYEHRPEYLAKAREVTAVRERVEARRQELRAAAEDEGRAAANDARTRAAADRARSVAVLKSYLQEVEDDIAEREKVVRATAAGLVELDALRADLVRESDLAQRVTDRLRVLDAEGGGPSRLRPYEEPTAVPAAGGAKELKLVLSPAVVAFGLTLLAVAWLDIRGGRVDGPDDLAALGVPVLAGLPAVRAGALRMFATPVRASHRRDYLQLADAVDMTRAMIAPVLHQPTGYLLAVTSAAAREGKTTVAGHLAVRLARSGRRTLLIDTDLRRPSVHALFDIPLGPGLGDFLTGDLGLEAIVQPGPVPALDLVSAGSADWPALTELFDRRLPDLLAAAGRRYEVVILDTAPLLGAAETIAVARAADGVLVAVRRDISRVPLVMATVDRLRAAGATVLGAVVNGTAGGRYGYYGQG